MGKAKYILAAGLMAAAAFIRLVPHVPNATPVAAVALFGGATLPAPWSLAVPLLTMLVSDAVIGFDAWPITIAIYGSFSVSVLLGRSLRIRRGPGRILGATLASSVLFYLVTNAAVWWWSGMYPRSLDGLLLSYFYAIPFFRHTLYGDMAYTFSLFLAADYAPVIIRNLGQWRERLAVAHQ